MGCNNSKSAGDAVIVSNHSLLALDPAKPQRKGPGEKNGAGKGPVSSNGTFSTVSTGGSGGGGQCCAETHTTHHSEHHCDLSSHGDLNHDDHAGMEENKRDSMTLDQVFHDDADGIRDRMKADGADLPVDFLHIDLPYDKPIEEVYSGVRDGPVLGEGVCGLVRRVTHRRTGEQFALKRLDLSNAKTRDEALRLREEIYIMCQLDHPNIPQLHEVYESPTEIFLVGELLGGGELFDRLDEQEDYRYTEAECARLVMDMLCSLRYIHSKGIVHRDLKLENFLFESRAPGSRLKMIDFGLSKHFNVGDTHCEVVGTPYTVAPEVVMGKYDERCDVWGIGVLAFFLLSGDPPFGGCGGPEPLHEVRDNIINGRYEFEPRDIWDGVSDDAKDFINTLLVTDPARRPTAREVQQLPWLKKWETGRMDFSQSGTAKLEVADAIKKSRSGEYLSGGVLGNLGIIQFEDYLEVDMDESTDEDEDEGEP